MSSPYEDLLPKDPPTDKNRVTFAAGITIDSPPGWTSRTVPIEAFMKDWITDQFVLEAKQPGQEKSTITIQRLGPMAQRQWDDFAKPGAVIGDRYTLSQFHGEPAFTRFLPGSGKSRAKSGQYHPWLSQQLVCKAQGQWFLLDFQMRNADDGDPYYTRPLKIIQDYFETFHYKPKGG